MTARYRYTWRNNTKRATLYGRVCAVLCWLPRWRSAVVEFDGGQRECVDRYALRRV